MLTHRGIAGALSYGRPAANQQLGASRNQAAREERWHTSARS
ncbi:hypothetical protein [Streptomyces formicae]|nr:hypothetical protein [Streptomyces formicae]